MADDRQIRAVELRKLGRSIKSIAHELGAAQSSVSIWVKQIILTNDQLVALRLNTHSPETIEKRRQSRLKSELAKRTVIIEGAKKDITSITKKELWLIGTALYWGEGGKTNSVTRLSNGDPRMIKLMMRFFIEVCEVDESKMRCHIHIHEHLDTIAAEEYWQSITGIPANKFYKTYNKPNKSSKGLRDTLPYGVCDLYVLDYKLQLQIKGWVEGIYESAIQLV